MMPFKYINIDLGMIVLNTTSVGVLALNWLSEHFSSAGGFFVMLSVATLNFAKAYNTVKQAKNDSKKDKKEENE